MSDYMPILIRGSEYRVSKSSHGSDSYVSAPIRGRAQKFCSTVADFAIASLTVVAETRTCRRSRASKVCRLAGEFDITATRRRGRPRTPPVSLII